MQDFMNRPIEHDWTDEEFISEYEKTLDIKKTAAAYCITVAEARKIINNK